MKYVLITGAVVIAAAVLFFFMKMGGTIPVTSFEECAQRYPVMESYPRRCVTPNGSSFTEDVPNTPEPVVADDEPVETAMVEGIVTNIDLEQMMVDGPALIRVDVQGGGTRVIAIPSMGIQMCNAKDAIASVSEIKVGDYVAVRGDVGPEGQIVPCQSHEHYLKIK
jgi:hypothetical protein